jgi:WD40 repeat protein
VWWAAVSSDGKLLAVQTQAANGPDTHVGVVQIATGKVLQDHLVPHGYAGLGFTRDGRELVALGCCASGSTVVSWDAHTGAQLFRRSAGVQASAIALAPDSRLVGVGTGDGKILLLDSRTGKQTSAPIQVAAGLIADLAFSPDGTILAVDSNDGTASLWDLRSRKRLGDPFPPYPGAIPEVLFEPNGRLLIPYLSNAYEWPTDVDTWERFACRVAGRDLTPQEWHDLLPSSAYRPVCPA